MKKSKLKKVISAGLATLMVLGTLGLTPQEAGKVQAAEKENIDSDRITIGKMAARASVNEEGYYEIASAEDFRQFATYVNTGNENANACLTENIDLNGSTWTSINIYAGTFDGNGKTITGLNDHIFVKLDGTVKNLIIKDSTSRAEDANATGGKGAITGWNNGTIEKVIVDNCSWEYGAYSYLGGIAGWNQEKGVIRDCAVINTKLKRRWGGASGDQAKPIGGIVDSNEGTVENCFTYGCTFESGTTRGGIIAQNNAPINSYYYTSSDVDNTVGGTQATETAFRSGEIAYLLNDGKTDGTQVWYQMIGSDVPHMNGTAEETIYKGYTSCQNIEPIYANEPLSEVKPDHTFGDWTDNGDGTSSHTCTVCEVKETMPIVDTPTVDGFIYDPDKTLEDVTIISGSNPVEGSWSWKTPSTVPTVDNSGYTAVFTPSDTEKYIAAEKTVTVEVTKATPVVNALPTAAAITYGQTLDDSVLSNGTAKYDGTDAEVTGSYAWTTGTIKPVAADSDTTEYDVTFTPSDSVNYNSFTVKVKLTVKKIKDAPNWPEIAIETRYLDKTVGEIELPPNWKWKESDATKELKVGEAVKAIACYEGEDKDNYENNEAEVEIIRGACVHIGETEIRNVKSATCTEDGYTGDTYCKDCGEMIETGKGIKATGHKWGEWKVTTKATYDKEGVETRVCTVCGKKETRAIAKLTKPEENQTVTKDETYTVESMQYKVTKVAGSKAGTVTYTGTTEAEKITSLTIGKTVQIGGKTYNVTAISDKAFKNNKKLKKVTVGANVTSIGKEAFSGCKALKTIIIQSKSLKKVGKNAIKAINKKATIKVPGSKVKAYKKLFKSSTGFKKSMKIKK